jgi:hypothetical protein
MTTQKQYLVEIQISAIQINKITVSAYNQKEAIGLAAKKGIVINCKELI